MAEVSSAHVGRDLPGEPGSSMRGVTGREPGFSLADAFKADSIKPDPNQRFDLPVDSELKAKKLKIYSVARPHMRAFHLSWFAFFTAFTSTFAAAPLLPIIRDNLNLTKPELGNAAVASVTGAVGSRLLMGPVCDLLGPRFGHSFMMMLTAPAVFSMAHVSTPIGFIICRMCIGFSLATFVSTQFWMSIMFNAKIVGVANGISAGWGNLGGGATQLIMPVVFRIITAMGVVDFTAWRVAFFIPGCLHILVGLLCLGFSQDLPDGQYSQLKKSGQKTKDSFGNIVYYAVTNYRTWIMTLTYGYCFGVELTVDNIIANYFYDRWFINLETAGAIGASFGLMNFVSRPLGGVASDFAARRFGMRGRLWFLFLIQILGGVFCICLGKMSHLGWAIVFLLLFSFCCQCACGATFGVVPFISRRALGVISGFVGAGGSAGSAVTTAVFFGVKTTYSTQQGIFYMGIMICCCTLPILLVWFPQWGGALFPPSKKESATVENYYASEYTDTEKAKGMADMSMKFAENAKGERGPQAGGKEQVELTPAGSKI